MNKTDLFYGVTPLYRLAWYQGVTNASTGHVFIAHSPEVFGYDADGNLTNDGRWAFYWDAENQLTNMTSLPACPWESKLKLDFLYDYQGRRVQKIVWTNNGTEYFRHATNRYVYDGWNLVALLDGANNPVYSFQWGLDASGSMQGAGGVGGLLSMKVHGGSYAGTYFYVYDGNYNVVGVMNAANGTPLARYEYGPFGELIRSTGPLASTNCFRFSTKYQDNESEMVYYGFRYYNPSPGRWLSRDPLTDEAFLRQYGKNMKWKAQKHLRDKSLLPCYLFVNNSPANHTDKHGLFHVWGYWCGGRWTGGYEILAADYDWEADPITDTYDALDNCCRDHDACYANWDLVTHNWRTGTADEHSCDQTLCLCAQNNWTLQNSAANAAIQCWMCDKVPQPASPGQNQPKCCPLLTIRF